jgi:D-sedoheptulose 7-phosphate isomerase
LDARLIDEIIESAFDTSADVIRRTLAGNRDSIRCAAEVVSGALAAGGKVLLCGNGGSAADAQHFAAELVGRFLKERRALPALALSVNTSVVTAIGNDCGFDQVFARQVEALGRGGDVLVCLSTSGRSPNVVAAARRGRDLGLTVVSLTGADAELLSLCSDVVVAVPSRETPRVQEAHGVICHAICRILERILFS